MSTGHRRSVLPYASMAGVGPIGGYPRSSNRSNNKAYTRVAVFFAGVLGYFLLHLFWRPQSPATGNTHLAYHVPEWEQVQALEQRAAAVEKEVRGHGSPSPTTRLVTNPFTYLPIYLSICLSSCRSVSRSMYSSVRPRKPVLWASPAECYGTAADKGTGRSHCSGQAETPAN